MNRRLTLLFLLIAALALLSLHVGVNVYRPSEVWDALTREGTDNTSLIIRTLRLPRVVLSLVVGAALAACGLLMQSVTRNPIAEPGLLGVNAGAAFAAAALLTFAPAVGMGGLMLAAGAGALVATGFVFGLARAAGAGISPLHMLLAGVTISALLSAGLQVMIVLNEMVMQTLLFWTAGSFADRPVAGLWIALPVTFVVLSLAALFAPALDVLQTDDATVSSVGLPVGVARALALVCAGILAGCAVAMAGPVAFIGLIAPHLARLSGAQGHRQLLPLTILWGMVLAVGADILSRFIRYPVEAPVGAVMALFGVPLLVVLLRRNRMSF